MLFAGILLFAGTQYGFCQRHVTYKGVCINGNVEKVKKEMEKKGNISDNIIGLKIPFPQLMNYHQTTLSQQ